MAYLVCWLCPYLRRPRPAGHERLAGAPGVKGVLQMRPTQPSGNNNKVSPRSSVVVGATTLTNPERQREYPPMLCPDYAPDGRNGRLDVMWGCLRLTSQVGAAAFCPELAGDVLYDLTSWEHGASSAFKRRGRRWRSGRITRYRVGSH